MVLGMSVTACAAAVSSFAGLRSLAAASGWPQALSPLLPFTVDAYAMTATRVWLSGATRSVTARQFARWNAVMAIGLSLIGNAVWHLVAAHVLTVTWVTVVTVGAIPPLVLGLLSHLAVLRGQDDEDSVPATKDNPEDRSGVVDDQRELLTQARELDAVHRAEQGKPITRDMLRKHLHVSTERASAIMRTLRKEQSD
ncbi:MAG: DUF2637 domain-containing protein [Streptosporangiaceae bacterium]|nr:DUF2637 domain-containing protein [Streptosporangiaceae bacterium]